MKPRLATLLILVWSIVLQAMANMGVAGGPDYTLCASLGNDGAAYITAPAGLQTGLWAATDDGGGVSEVYWYDRNGRKAYESIDTGPGRVCRAMRYNYAGQQNEDYELVYDKTVLPWKSWRVQRNISYDNAGRIATEKTKLDTCTVITNYTYDGAGRVSRTVTGLLEESTTMLGGTMSSDNVRRDYTYDVHGWPVKIVTGVPMEKAPVFPGTLDISTPYYEAASASALPQLSFRKQEYTETIHYADGANPRYNGTPSARGLTRGGRYDYRYDDLDRLIAADYTAPSGTPDADFSTEYTYDILSRLTSIKRHGVVDIDGDTEVFGILDDITMTYSGAVLARMQSNITEETGRNFYGRTGWAEGTFMPSATVNYNAAGRLTSDSGRMLGAVSYNTIGLPTRYSTGAGSSASTSPRKERCYDATGRKLRQTEYEAVRGKMTKTSDRRYVGSMTFNADTLERVDFTGGHFDGRGAAHYLFTDWQGNVTITTEAAGKIEQHIGYYPYGEPSGQRATLFAGKERLSGQATGDFDFGPRGYRSTTGHWDSWDQKSDDYPWWSPWTYCGGNPIKNIDPSGHSPISVFAKLAAKQSLKEAAKTYIETQVKQRLRNYASEAWGKQLLGDALELIDLASGQSWWEYAIEFIPLAGDAYSGYQFTSAGYKVWKLVDRIDAAAKYGSKLADKAWKALTVNKNLTGKGDKLLERYIKKFNNQGAHLNINDLGGTIKEIFGFKSNGQHYKEATEAISGMGHQLKDLSDKIDSGAFSGETLKAAKSLYNEVQNRKSMLSNIIIQAKNNAKKLE